jgi:glucose-1-phosphate adenylyltransferase
LDGATVRASLISDGCAIGDGAVIENSIIGLRCQIGAGAVIRNSILMGSDDYETAEEATAAAVAGWPPVGIGAQSVIEGAIIDKNCRIGRGVRIANDRGVDTSEETPEAMIRDGIACVQKGAVLPDGWRM